MGYLQGYATGVEAAEKTNPFAIILNRVNESIVRRKAEDKEREKEVFDLRKALITLGAKAVYDKKLMEATEKQKRKTSAEEFQRELPYKEKPLTIQNLMELRKPTVRGPGGRMITGEFPVGGEQEAGEYGSLYKTLEQSGFVPTGQTGTGELTVKQAIGPLDLEKINNERRRLDIEEADLTRKIAESGSNAALEQYKAQIEADKVKLDQLELSAKIGANKPKSLLGFKWGGTSPEEVEKTRTQLFGGLGNNQQNKNKIKVKVIATGETGTIEAWEFDPTIYTKIR